MVSIHVQTLLLPNAPFPDGPARALAPRAIGPAGRARTDPRGQPAACPPATPRQPWCWSMPGTADPVAPGGAQPPQASTYMAMQVRPDPERAGGARRSSPPPAWAARTVQRGRSGRKRPAAPAATSGLAGRRDAQAPGVRPAREVRRDLDRLHRRQPLKGSPRTSPMPSCRPSSTPACAAARSGARQRRSSTSARTRDAQRWKNAAAPVGLQRGRHGLLAVGNDRQVDIGPHACRKLSSRLVALQAQTTASGNAAGRRSASQPDRAPGVLAHPVVAGLSADLARQEARLDGWAPGWAAASADHIRWRCHRRAAAPAARHRVAPHRLQPGAERQRQPAAPGAGAGRAGRAACPGAGADHPPRRGQVLLRTTGLPAKRAYDAVAGRCAAERHRTPGAPEQRLGAEAGHRRRRRPPLAAAGREPGHRGGAGQRCWRWVRRCWPNCATAGCAAPTMCPNCSACRCWSRDPIAAPGRPPPVAAFPDAQAGPDQPDMSTRSADEPARRTWRLLQVAVPPGERPLGELLRDVCALGDADIARIVALQAERELRFGEAALQLGLVQPATAAGAGAPVRLCLHRSGHASHLAELGVAADPRAWPPSCGAICARD